VGYILSNVYEKLMNIQNELKAPKNQYNNFGKYKYRSCEDILEALKPLLKKYKATLLISDEMCAIGERYYLNAMATFIDIEDGEKIVSTASAREAETKKGMDDAQITGSTSSYARKYALNGMFAIDDTKDSDATNKGEEKAPKQKGSLITEEERNVIYALMKELNVEQEAVVNIIKVFGYDKSVEIQRKDYNNILAKIKEVAGK